MQASLLQQLASIGADDTEGGGDGQDTSGIGDLSSMQAMVGTALGLDAVDPTGAATGSADALRAIRSLDGGGDVASTAPASAGAAANAQIVADEARRQGVDPVMAVAMMLVESGGNSSAVGDGGTSFGLFQLHEGGMLTSAGLSPRQAFDPRTNASVAMRSLAHEASIGPNRSPGAIAAASQRPADPAGYARRVDSMLDRARALLAGR